MLLLGANQLDRKISVTNLSSESNFDWILQSSSGWKWKKCKLMLLFIAMHYWGYTSLEIKGWWGNDDVHGSCWSSNSVDSCPQQSTWDWRSIWICAMSKKSPPSKQTWLTSPVTSSLWVKSLPVRWILLWVCLRICSGFNLGSNAVQGMHDWRDEWAYLQIRPMSPLLFPHVVSEEMVAPIYLLLERIVSSNVQHPLFLLVVQADGMLWMQHCPIEQGIWQFVNRNPDRMTICLKPDKSTGKSHHPLSRDIWWRSQGRYPTTTTTLMRFIICAKGTQMQWYKWTFF